MWYRHQCTCSPGVPWYGAHPSCVHGLSVSSLALRACTNVCRSLDRNWNHLLCLQAGGSTNHPNPGSRLRRLRHNREVKRVLLFGTRIDIYISDSDLIFCVPMFVELWATDPAKVEYFKTIHGLVCLVLMVTELYNCLTREGK